jgi:hypothetical protein
MHYGKSKFFQSAKAARKKRRRPLTERARPAPASYGMTETDLAQISGRGDSRKLFERLSRGRWAEEDE